MLPRADKGDAAMPSWWQPSTHDAALVRGVLQHGFGAFKAIYSETALFGRPTSPSTQWTAADYDGMP